MLLSSTTSIVKRFNKLDSAIQGNSHTTLEWIVERAFIIQELDTHYKENKKAYNAASMDAGTYKDACGIDKSVWSRAKKMWTHHTPEKLDEYVVSVYRRIESAELPKNSVPTEKGYCDYLVGKKPQERQAFDGFVGEFDGEKIKITTEEMTPEHIAALHVLGWVKA
jgi:hypothetical protein